MTLPKDFSEKVEAAANARWLNNRIYNHHPNEYFIAGAQYVISEFTQLHTLQQERERLRKALGQIASSPCPSNEAEVWSWYETARTIANAALTAQPEADNQQKS